MFLKNTGFFKTYILFYFLLIKINTNYKNLNGLSSRAKTGQFFLFIHFFYHDEIIIFYIKNMVI
jgi:hypothetical protein